MGPADRNIVSIIMGNANPSPASETVPSWPTYQASAIRVTIVTNMAIMFGAARRTIVGPIGVVKNGLKPPSDYLFCSRLFIPNHEFSEVLA